MYRAAHFRARTTSFITKPSVLRDIGALSRALARPRDRGVLIGFVPTMGTLHAGHHALVEASRRTCGFTVVSIYVNPLQFESPEAFRRYPRALVKDLELLRRWNVDAVYCPTEHSFPGTRRVRVIETEVSRRYEGAVRPGHFDGVLTIVAKLFLHVRPALAFFGEKDFQQLWLIRRMAEELPFGVKIVGVPTVREPESGLACSSRNRLLSVAARARASEIYRALLAGRELARTDRRPGSIEAAVRRRLRSGGFRVHYAALVDSRNFVRPRGRLKSGVPYRLLVSCNLNGVHLIDNVPVPLR